MIRFTDIIEPTRECLIDDEIVPYTAMGTDSLEESKAFYKNLRYIGSSNTYFINGTKNVSENIYHFFV